MPNAHRTALRSPAGAARRACLLAALLLFVSPLPAQTFTGRIVDASTGQPIPQATVRLLNDRGGRPVAQAQTDSSGAYSVSAGTAGVYRVRAERLGYHAAAGAPVRVRGGGTFPVDLRLHPQSVELSALVVTGRVTPPFRNRVARRFFERMERASGHFISPDVMEARQPVILSNMLRVIPSVRQEFVRDQEPRIVMRRSASRRGPETCTPTIYLNGRHRRVYGRLDDIVDADRLWAIEVYPTAYEAPLALPPRGDLECGVIAIWTRDA